MKRAAEDIDRVAFLILVMTADPTRSWHAVALALVLVSFAAWLIGHLRGERVFSGTVNLKP